MDSEISHADARATSIDALALSRANAPDSALRFVPVGEEGWGYCRALAQVNMEPYLTKRGQRWSNAAWNEKARSRELFELYSDREKIGFVSLWTDTEPTSVHIGDVQLEAHARNRGFGTDALRRVFAIARSRGRSEVTLNVFRDNPAIHLYERMGFVVIDHGFDKLKMRCEIRSHDDAK